MGFKEKELLKKLLVTFKAEAEEHILAMSSGLIELEKASSPEKQGEIVETVFREAHSLKGAARAVNLVQVEGECQSLESLFAQLKAGEITLSPELFDRLHQAVDVLGALFSAGLADNAADNAADDAADNAANDAAEGAPADEVRASHATEVREPARAIAENIPAPPRMRDEKQTLSETLRVPAFKLESLLRQAEELIPIKGTAAQRATEVREVGQTLSAWEAEWRKVRPHAHAIHTLAEVGQSANGQSANGQGANQQLRPSSGHSTGSSTGPSNGQSPSREQIAKVTDFLDRNATILRSLENKLANLAKDFESDRRTLDRRVDELVEDTKRVLTIPFSALLESFPKLVRDLCRDCGKDADLLITGGEIEAERRILEEMKDPLIHLLRNCVDHGVERPKQREERGKPGRATINLAIFPKNTDKVEILVSDDGAGIDVKKIRAAAVRLGLTSAEDAARMDERQTASLIFKSGVSTSPMITEVSGRGLGLAIVREKVEKVGGSVSIESTPGVGTTFRLILPLTLARFRGIQVRVGERFFVLPTRYVQRVLRVSADEIKSAENRETIEIDGRAVSAVRLTDVLELTQRTADSDAERKLPVLVLVLAWAGEQIGFIVDEILDEQEVLIKSLGRQLRRVRNIAGATVLGNGKILPVLNVADLMQSAVNLAPGAVRHEAQESPQSILVAEDSITARTLLKNILEFAGYKVKTAVDGVEALSALGNEVFDLVVSDVEMPRMSGFDLTAKIRADKRLSELPVVLVTALESREHRERGIDVGANAYIVKSSFDQGNLLEVVRRLI
jgi:two-component system chemotaxis sensor kinase CheA